MSTFSKSKNVLLGLGSAIAGISTFHYINNDKYKVFAAWTTNYEPSPCAKWNENWDLRSPTNVVQKDPNNNEIIKPQAARHIILIRHGQYNLEGQNDRERYLTKLGKLQAEYTGKRLQELKFPYTEIVKSTMTRAQETGTIITTFLPNVPVSHCDLLREGAPCPPEPPVGGYRPEKYFFTDGARIEAAFRKYFHRADPQQKEDSFHVIVCHANVIRYLVCKAMQFPVEAWLRISLNHASITWITITPSGRCILRTLGDVGFMPRDAMTTS